MNKALARRAVACERWRWLLGMRTTRGYMVAADGWTVDPEDRPPCAPVDAFAAHALSCRDLPDLDDPATLGCLLALVREAWQGPVSLSWQPYSDGWDAWLASERIIGQGCTVTAALVQALEIAPCKEQQNEL